MILICILVVVWLFNEKILKYSLTSQFYNIYDENQCSLIIYFVWIRVISRSPLVFEVFFKYTNNNFFNQSNLTEHKCV